MKITNKNNLPEALVRFAERDHHKKSDYSATEIIKPVQAVILENRHKNEITRDVSEMIWMLFGTALHSVVEKHSGKSEIEEARVSCQIAGKEISGIADLYDGSKISDWKTTAVYKILKKDYKDWEEQLNIYAYMFRDSGFDVSEIEVVAMLRDWQRSKTFDPSYPDSQVVKISLPLWSVERQRAFITERVNALMEYENKADEWLPECTPEERWADPVCWKVYKTEKHKRAVKIHYNEDAAIKHAASIGGVYNKHEGNAFKRCDYCNAREFCHQYKQGAQQ